MNASGYVLVFTATAVMAERSRRRNTIVASTLCKEQTMTKQTLQGYINKQVKVVDVLQDVICGTLVDLTDDSLVLQTPRNTIVVSYNYVVQFWVKNI
ncbi:MAG: hypothetical protein IKC52_00095 [Clostridia bacterium]|nr:hypothetical protein [Clostridia bacterium]